jgi:hypothetical protein
MVRKRKKMPANVLDILRGKVKGVPRLEDLVQHFFDIAGGPRAVAKMMHTEYVASKQGGINRSRILAAILQATKAVGVRTPKGEDTSLLSDEDVERALGEAYGELEAVDAEGEAEEEEDHPGDREPPAGPALDPHEPDAPGGPEQL